MKKIIESKGEFRVTFGNKSFISTELHSKLIESIEFLVKESGNLAGIKSDATKFDSSLELSSAANEKDEKGNFTARFILIVKHPLTSASDILGTVLSWIELKQHLKGIREKGKQEGKDKLVIKNKDGKERKFSTTVVEQFFASSRVDTSIANFFSENDSQHISFNLNESSIKIFHKEFLMMVIIIISPIKNPDTSKPLNPKGELISRKKEVLHIKNPDLLRYAMWGFLGKDEDAFYAKVADPDFVKQVHDGMELHAGLRIRCMLHRYKSGSNKPKYIVKKVFGAPF